MKRMVRRSADVVGARAARAAGWDESKHPRVPAGSSAGGEFTGGAAGDTADGNFIVATPRGSRLFVATDGKHHTWFFADRDGTPVVKLNLTGSTVKLARFATRADAERFAAMDATVETLNAGGNGR